MSKPTYTVSQVVATPEGSWVSADVYAVLSGIKPPRGKGPWTATLSDSTGQIVGKFWGGDISHWDGKRVKLSGQGMQRKAYNGTPELSVGQKADISFAGAPGTAAQNDDIPFDQALAKPSRPAPQSPSTAQGNPVHGATVGASINKGVEIWLATEGSAGAPWDTKALTRVGQIARQLVHLASQIERGEQDDESVPF